MKKQKGFTLIELLVVIAIIAMLMAILMPALGRVRRMAQQLVCGTNLSGLGKACILYSNDNDEDLPIAGGKGDDTWGTTGAMTNDWNDTDKDWSGDDTVTVSASLYLLIREADVGPKQFVCPSSDQKEFTGEEMGNGGSTNAELTDIWDFGGKTAAECNSDPDAEGPANCVSYAYHYPYNDAKDNAYPLTASSSSGCAVMADRNPWRDPDLDTGNADEETYLTIVQQLNQGTDPGDDWTEITKWKRMINNSNAHQREGQSVLYIDGHTAFEKRVDVGVQNDNIYSAFSGANATAWDDVAKRLGEDNSSKRTPGESLIRVKSSEDSHLVNDSDGSL